jgi:hypothetical protein
MKFALIGVAAAAAATVTPALARAVVEYPGHCAQYCPNANCQNYGPGDPVIERFYREDWLHSPYNAFMDPSFHQRHPMHCGS